MSDISQRLADLGLELPDAPAPAANYVPYVISGNTLYVSGQISIDPSGDLITGKVGVDLSVEEGAKAAERCGLALLAQANAACGGRARNSKAQERPYSYQLYWCDAGMGLAQG